MREGVWRGAKKGGKGRENQSWVLSCCRATMHKYYLHDLNMYTESAMATTTTTDDQSQGPLDHTVNRSTALVCP